MDLILLNLAFSTLEVLLENGKVTLCGDIWLAVMSIYIVRQYRYKGYDTKQDFFLFNIDIWYHIEYQHRSLIHTRSGFNLQIFQI